MHLLLQHILDYGIEYRSEEASDAVNGTFFSENNSLFGETGDIYLGWGGLERRN